MRKAGMMARNVIEEPPLSEMTVAEVEAMLIKARGRRDWASDEIIKRAYLA